MGKGIREGKEIDRGVVGLGRVGFLRENGTWERHGKKGEEDKTTEVVRSPFSRKLI